MVSPSPVDVLIASDVFYEAMDEDDDATRGTRMGIVSASIERGRLGTGEPGFSESRHGCVRMRM